MKRFLLMMMTSCSAAYVDAMDIELKTRILAMNGAVDSLARSMEMVSRSTTNCDSIRSSMLDFYRYKNVPGYSDALSVLEKRATKKIPKLLKKEKASLHQQSAFQAYFGLGCLSVAFGIGYFADYHEYMQGPTPIQYCLKRVVAGLCGGSLILLGVTVLHESFNNLAKAYAFDRFIDEYYYKKDLFRCIIISLK
jgi:hypothetical protein